MKKVLEKVLKGLFTLTECNLWNATFLFIAAQYGCVNTRDGSKSFVSSISLVQVSEELSPSQVQVFEGPSWSQVNYEYKSFLASPSQVSKSL